MRKLLLLISVAASITGKAQSQQAGHVFHFDTGKNEIKKEDQQWIDSVAKVLGSASSYSISIKAYCDGDGSDESNIMLAKAREKSVKDLCLDHKLNSSSITSVAFGENDPVGDNTTKEGKAKNRRAEVSVNYQLPVSKKTEEKPVVKEETTTPGKTVVSKAQPGGPVADLSSVKLEVGKTLILKNMNFEGGTAVLMEESEPTLKELLKIMKEHPTMEIEIGGHVCCGPDMELSILRAKKVYSYLKGYGIDEKRMSYKGYSFDKPIASERTEEGRTANRRVEITILKL